jgi:hypothetical protein
MERRENIGTYFCPGRFDNPDDQLAFIGGISEALFDDARRGFDDHGRGVVVLQAASGPGSFVRAWYGTPDARDCEAFSPTSWEDWERYDPCREMLVGVTDAGQTYLRFWRIGLNP